MYASQRHMLPEPTRPKFNVRQPRGPPKPQNMDKMQLTIQKWTDDKVQQGKRHHALQTELTHPAPCKLH